MDETLHTLNQLLEAATEDCINSPEYKMLQEHLSNQGTIGFMPPEEASAWSTWSLFLHRRYRASPAFERRKILQAAIDLVTQSLEGSEGV